MDANYADMVYGQQQAVPLPQPMQPQPSPFDAIAAAPPQELPAPPPGQPSFIDKLRSDPAMLQSMLMVGARLMQGPRPGQDALGAIGDAVIVGSATHNMLKGNEQQAQLDAIEQDRKNRLAEAQIGQTNANTASTVQETSQKAAAFPETQKKVQEEIINLRRRNDLEGIKIIGERYKNEPARLAEEWGLDKKKTQASINASNASANSSNATADWTRTRKADDVFETDQKQILADATGKYTAEQKAAARLALNKGNVDKTGKSAATDKMAEMEAYLQAGNPEMSAPEVKKLVAKMFDPSGLKGEEFQTLKIMAESGDKDQQAFALDKLAEKVGYKRTAPATPEKKKGSSWFGGKNAEAPASVGVMPPAAQRTKGMVWNGLVWNGTGWDAQGAK